MVNFAPRTGTGHAFQLHLPETEPPDGGFPLLWLLDAPTTWAPMQHALDATGRAGSVAVIGIGWEGEGAVDQGLRRRDFTLPALDEVPPPRGGAEWGYDGDSDTFLNVLSDTVQPAACTQLPIDPSRQSLVGHSLSGLFVLNTLLRRPGLFQHWCAASPSLWWDGRRIFGELKQHSSEGLRGASVLVSVGSEEQRVGPERPAGAGGAREPALLGEPHMVDNASEFAERLAALGANCTFQLFEGESHGGVLPAAMTMFVESIHAG